MQIRVGERRFGIDLYRDDAGNFVADAIGRAAAAGARPVLAARAIAASAEAAIESLTGMLDRMYSCGRSPGDASAASPYAERTGSAQAS
jgi:hypothetical protein